MALTEYINQVRRLLHDANAQYWSDAELTDDINQARQKIALDTGCVRQLANFYLSQSAESYPFSGALASLTVTGAGSGFTSAPTISFSGGGGTGATATASISSGTVSGVTITANGSGFTSAPTVSFSGGGGSNVTATASIMLAMDILGISVNWGNSWVALGYTYFSEFQAKARYWRTQTGQPTVWSKGPPSDTGGGDYFYIFQIPSSSYQCDVDAIVSPNPLIDDTTVEQLRYPYTDLVQYYAAYLAKFKQQEMQEATNFFRIYEEMLRQGQAGRYQRRIPNPYAAR